MQIMQNKKRDKFSWSSIWAMVWPKKTVAKRAVKPEFSEEDLRYLADHPEAFNDVSHIDAG